MIPVYSQTGECVGWLDDDSVVDRSGQHVAFIEEGAVFAYDGRYLGVLDEGFLRDREGYAVAFVEGATGGPLTPIPRIPPIPPIPRIRPISPIPPIPPIPSIPKLSWSAASWEEFLYGPRLRRRSGSS